MRVDIGVFAHNEAKGIADMVARLLAQDLSGLEARILVLANGCTDATADLARAAGAEVADLAEGGKSRTWNRFVHDLSRGEAQLLVFADADIDFPAPDCLRRLILGLAARPEPLADLLATSLTVTEAPRALIDETIFGWHREAAGYKIRHVPATLPDMLKTRAVVEWEYRPQLGRTAEQALGAFEDRLAWMRNARSDYEIALPLHELEAFTEGAGYYAGLPGAVRAEQLLVQLRVVAAHVEAAGIHSGDSACSLPPYTLPKKLQDELRRQTTLMARALKVKGLMNVQFAIQGEGDNAVVYVLEVNPRASRTVPFVSKATGIQLAKVAARCMAGQTLDAQGIGAEVTPPYFSVKEAVFPFVKFPGVDTILGPEMKSTGEVMGVGKTFGEAFVKSQLGAGTKLPTSGKVFLTVKNNDKPRAVEIARELVAMGFDLVATRGTAAAISAAGVPVQTVNKVTEGRPHIVDMIKNGDIALVINTVEERRNAITDSRAIRTSALLARVTTFTTIAGAEAAVEGMKYLDQLDVISVQEMHAQL